MNNGDFETFKVIFSFDPGNQGVIWNFQNPTMLDSIIAYALAPYKSKTRYSGNPMDKIDNFSLPLMKWEYSNAIYGWCASALYIVGDVTVSTEWWRKRFDYDLANGITSGSPNNKMGQYRDHNNPIQKVLCRRIEGYAYGNLGKIAKILKRHVKFIGKKGAYGYGRFDSIDFERINDDFSIVRDGRAMRWLPDPDGIRQVRTLPPYSNRTEITTCCEIGDEYDISQLTIK